MYKIFIDANDEIMDLRKAVFVGEQRVPLELELEDDESEFLHLCKYVDAELVAYTRVSFRYNLAHIGRVVVPMVRRGLGHGRDIMIYAEQVIRLCGYSAAVLHAQTSARGFYSKLGYIEASDVFVEAGIEHVIMQKLVLSHNA